MKSEQINSAFIKDLTSQVVMQAIIPNVLIAIVLNFINTAIVGAYVIYNWEQTDLNKMTILAIYSGSVPIFAYGVWVARKAILKAFEITYGKLLGPMLREHINIFVRREGISQKDFEDTLYLVSLRDWMGHKLSRFPGLIRRFVLFIVNRTLRLSQGAYESGTSSQDIDGSTTVTLWIESFIVSRFRNVIENFFPRWVALLIPLNVLALVFLLYW